MSYVDTDVRERTDVAQKLVTIQLHPPPRRVSVPDRIALRLGLWLLLRSTAHVRDGEDHESQVRRLRLERERETRAHADRWERRLWLR